MRAEGHVAGAHLVALGGLRGQVDGEDLLGDAGASATGGEGATSMQASVADADLAEEAALAD